MRVYSVDLSFHKKSIQMTLDSQLSIQLEENPTTGYRWQIDDSCADLFTIISSKFTPAQTSAIGAGGIRKILLQPVKEGKYKLHLRRFQPWQHEETADIEFLFDVYVSR